jgi:hypothetical protein
MKVTLEDLKDESRYPYKLNFVHAERDARSGLLRARLKNRGPAVDRETAPLAAPVGECARSLATLNRRLLS